MRLRQLFNIVTLLAVLVFIGCSEEGTQPAKVTDNSNVYVNEWNFPYSDNIYFIEQSTGDIISLSDRSLWQITGSTNPVFSAGVGDKDLTIQEANNTLPDPVDGIRSDYFMSVPDVPPNYFVKPLLNLTILLKDTVHTAQRNTGDIFPLSNGDLWLLTGSTNVTFSLNYIVDDITIYSNTSSIPDPETGYRTNYYMDVLHSPLGFFVEPINGPVIFKEDSITFSNQNTGDMIVMSDNSQWLLTGSSNTTFLINSGLADLIIYTDTDALPDPQNGYRTNYYMCVAGSPPCFYVEQL